MSRKQKHMICRAYRRHNEFRPVGGRASFSECFTIDERAVILWYDTPDRSTHVIVMKKFER